MEGRHPDRRRLHRPGAADAAEQTASPAYVLVRVYSPEEKDVVALVTNDDWLRFWCNGELVLAQPLCFETPAPLAVHLRAGWNTLLAKVSNWENPFSFRLQLTVENSEVARAFGTYLDKQGWNDRTKSLLGSAPGDLSRAPVHLAGSEVPR